MTMLDEGKETLQDILSNVKDGMTVSKVFGEPYEKNGTTVIPVAAVRGGGGGGGGGGEGPDGEGEGHGSGGGFGLTARPVGAYVLDEEGVKWEPALDVSRIAIGGQIIAVVALLVVRSLIKSRAKVRLAT
ncbi:MAG: spore germination protein GerW family protein [Acidimicrobiia bacterium]|nr:spore germination protein GerW family protein [Acidimicrobiia bacterium]